ncbi:hypothetical protein MPER_02150, partial [Moniliophthora perniciosa FA553]
MSLSKVSYTRITPATEAELEYERQVAVAEGSSGLPTIVLNDSEDVMDTVKVLDDADVTVTEAFLASLILASKFTQDKCYSTRAWAKLSGLPPREIGRCERALGDALEWRLWVGKSPSSQTVSAQASTETRP